MTNILFDYYRASLAPIVRCENDKEDTGFFRFGNDTICYGQCATGVAADVPNSVQFDASKALSLVNSEIRLPFDMASVVENLRRERYTRQSQPGPKRIANHRLIRECYYFIRALLPVGIRRHLQRAYFKGWQNLAFPRWPVDCTVDGLHEALLRLSMMATGRRKVPFVWFWPDGASGCLILTHDVETAVGRDFCSSLMDIDLAHGFRASFQVVPEKRYEVPESFVDEIRGRGFEFNIHDLNHDGHLFDEKSEFLRRAQKINGYAKRYNARGFRAGAMYRNLDWYPAFEFSYDMSVPNVAHLEPQRGGCCTVMPFFVGKLLEIPLTATQDYSLFHILNECSIDLWKRQIELIERRNGLISFITHPDYLIRSRQRGVYEALLAHLREVVDRDFVWATLPGELDQWWRARSEMRIIHDGNGLRIVGPQCERARIAYATLDDEGIVYNVEGIRDAA